MLYDNYWLVRIRWKHQEVYCISNKCLKLNIRVTKTMIEKKDEFNSYPV
jgi:hypothetical protein